MNIWTPTRYHLNARSGQIAIANAKTLGITNSYETMWDEVSEGSQIIKSAEDSSMSSTKGWFQTFDADRIHASYESGVLTVTIPVAPSAKPRKIEIESDMRQEAITAS